MIAATKDIREKNILLKNKNPTKAAKIKHPGRREN